MMTRARPRWLPCIALLAGFAPAAPAESWNINTGGNWSEPTHWVPNNVPNAATAVATFGNIIPENFPATITVDVAVQLNEIAFASAGSRQYIIALGQNGSLSFSGAANRISIGATHEWVHEIRANLVVSNSDLSIHLGGEQFGILMITGNVSEQGGARKLKITGAQILHLLGTNSHSGGTEIDRALVEFTDDLALGAVGSGVTLKDGANIRNNTANAITLGAHIALVGSGGKLGNVRVNGVISGEGGLETYNAELVGTNTFTGGVRSTGNFLSINADAALGNAANNLTFDSQSLIALGDVTSARTFTLPGNNANAVRTIDTRNAHVKLTGPISGAADSGHLRKIGAGRLTLEHNNNVVSGRVDVDEGILQLDGQIVTGGGIFVSGAKFKGAGVVAGRETIKAAAKKAPGKSTGTMTTNGEAIMEAGSTYEFEIDNALGVPGGLNGWDLWQVNGPFSILGPCALELHSLASDDLPGLAANFSPGQSYTWTILTAAGGISGFSPGIMTVDAANFLNSTVNGNFAVEQSANSIRLRFTPAPACPGARGDGNCDGAVDFFDIDPFLMALFAPVEYQLLFCGGSSCAADADCSSAVDFFDIEPFLTCLLSSCGPCP